MRRSGLLACLGLALAAGIANSASIRVPSFAAKTSYRTGPPFSDLLAGLVGVADLNGDGAPDLVTLLGARVSVFLNKGHGTFRPRSDYQTGSSPDASTLADLNGDGKPDLITASRLNGGKVSILLNRGDGAFEPRRDISIGGGIPINLAIADLNRDDKPDLIVAHGGTVSVLLGNGDGTFRPKQDYRVGGSTGLGDALGVADLNGDGNPDLVLSAGTVFVFLGTGDGSFQAPHTYARGTDSFALADLNRDGRPDLVTWFSACCGPVTVSLNRGDGSFGPARAYIQGGGIIPATGGAPDSVAIADLNGDGEPDLVARDEEAAGGSSVGFSVLLNRGDGSFGSRHDYRVLGDPLTSVVIGDVNGDGMPDLAVAFRHVSLFVNKGGGLFQARRDYPTDLFPLDLALADVNGDGRPDLVEASDHSVSVLLNRPGLCNVQDVRGMKPAVAKWNLARVNCRAAIRRVYDPKHRWPKGGLIDGQRPAFGAVLPEDGTVRLIVRFGRAG